MTRERSVCPDCGHPHLPMPAPWKAANGHVIVPFCDWPMGPESCTCKRRDLPDRTERDRLAADLRNEFVRLLTTDSETKDRRRRDFNQAIFHPQDGAFGGGWAVFNGTDLSMVMEKFDRAVKKVIR